MLALSSVPISGAGNTPCSGPPVLSTIAMPALVTMVVLSVALCTAQLDLLETSHGRNEEAKSLPPLIVSAPSILVVPACTQLHRWTSDTSDREVSPEIKVPCTMQFLHE